MFSDMFDCLVLVVSLGSSSDWHCKGLQSDENEKIAMKFLFPAFATET